MVLVPIIKPKFCLSHLNQIQGTGTEDGNNRLLNAYLVLNSLWFWQQQHDYAEIFTIPLFEPPIAPDTEVIGGFQAKNSIPVSIRDSRIITFLFGYILTNIYQFYFSFYL